MVCKPNWSLSVGKGANMFDNTNNLSNNGLELIYHPITQVRLHFYQGHWYVEYRRKPKYFFDKWWWFDDSKHIEYNDAFVRAQTLAAQGGTKEIRNIQTKIFNAVQDE